MAQHDYIISNQTFPNTRADINNLASAIATNNSGTSAPTTQYAGQFWIDTTTSTWTLYIHDGTDDIQFATIDTSANTVNFTDSALDVVTDTTPQLGGDLDLNSNDIIGTGNINITGNITASGNLAGTLTTASQPNITSVGTLTSFTSTGIDDNATSTAITIDSSENVGIGASNNTSYDANAQNFLIASSGNTGMTIRSAGATPFAMIHFADGTTDNDEKRAGRIIYQHNTDTLSLHTVNSERMRIDSSGNLMVGKTATTISNAGFSVLGGSNAGTLEVRRDIATANSSSVGYISRGTSDGNILTFYRDTSSVGSIGAFGGDVTIGNNDVGIVFGDGGNGLFPYSPTDGNYKDNHISLGNGSYRWRHLYLAGSVYLGGTGSANALDDYEEGTWTPVFTGTTSNPSVTYDKQIGTYTKIGNIVNVSFYLRTGSLSSQGSGNLQIGGLPFTINSTTDNFQSGIVALSNDFGSGNNPSSITAQPAQAELRLRRFTTSDATGARASNIDAGNLGTGASNNTVIGQITYRVS